MGDLSGAGTITTGSSNATYDGFTIGGTGSSTFAGTFADTDPANRGRLIKGGSGTQVMTGSVQHTGGTTIVEGTLQIGNAGTTGSLAGNVTNRGTLAFRRSDNYTFAGAISGVGTTSHSGGTLTLSGTNPVTGTLSVLGGRVLLSGSYAGAFHVSGNARLSLAGGSVGSVGSSSVIAASGLVDGFGTILGSVANSGTLAVGAGQTITVSGGTFTNVAGATIRALQGGVVDLSGASSLVNHGPSISSPARSSSRPASPTVASCSIPASSG